MNPTRNFETPDDLLKAWSEYKLSLEEKAKKWPRVQYVGKDGQRVEDYPKLPLTLEGFYVYGYEHYGTVKQYFVNKDGLYTEYVTICTRIKEEIRHDQITGGLLGNYNASITQRLNGLTEKTQTEISIEQSPFKSLILDVPSNDNV